MRIVTAFVSMLLVCGLASRALSTGTIDIQTTPFDNYIVIDIAVVDNGGSGGCTSSCAPATDVPPFFPTRWAVVKSLYR